MNGPNGIAISIGNSRTQVGRFDDGRIDASTRFDNRQPPAIVEHVVSQWNRASDKPNASIVIASVNETAAAQLESLLRDQLGVDIYHVGTDLPVPIGQDLEPETITGVDRLLNAAAAYDTLKQACVVVDAGTAVTVDFVDGEGTFHGGAIAPGARLQLRALHEFTAALPDVEFTAPTPEPFGRSTSQAMLRGAFHGIRGLVWRMVEQYSEHYGAYPTVVATGGDAETIFKDDELIDRIVNDLTLQGIVVAVRHALTAEEPDS